jgi:WD40 repeat protein
MIRLWNLKLGTLVRTLEGHTQPATCVDVSSDGKHILSGSHDAAVRMWKFTTDLNVAGGEMLELTVPNNTINTSCSFSPNGGALFI